MDVGEGREQDAEALRPTCPKACRPQATSYNGARIAQDAWGLEPKSAF